MKKLISFACGRACLPSALRPAAPAAVQLQASRKALPKARQHPPLTAPLQTASLAYLQNKGKMTIGYTVYEPMNYTDESGTFTGFDTELATAVW